jgi:hypothetical protein
MFWLYAAVMAARVVTTVVIGATTLSIMGIFATLRIHDTQHNDTYHNVTQHK